MTLCSSSFALSRTDQVTNAETVQTLDCVDSNFSFASTSNDAKKFRRMFPIKKSLKVKGKLKPKLSTSFNLVLFLTLIKVCWRTLKISRLLLNLTNQQRVKLKNNMMHMYNFGPLYPDKLWIVIGDQYSLDSLAVKSYWTVFFSLENRWVGTIDFFCIVECIDLMWTWSSKRI